MRKLLKAIQDNTHTGHSMSNHPEPVTMMLWILFMFHLRSSQWFN